MKQREVQDADGTRWVCVQALAGVEGAAADKAADLLESSRGTVPVVFTPSGGAETRRGELARDWDATLSDEELLTAITAAAPRAA